MTVTPIVIIGAVVALVIYDVIAYVVGGLKATISAVIWDWSKRYPFVPFVVGILMGHLFTCPGCV